MKAYLVEDSPVIRERLIPMLDALADVQVVGVGETEHDASRWLADNACDLVLVDLLLKQGSGFGVLRRLQAGATEASALRVVLTNQATPEARRRCAELGAAATFDKSRELDELFEFLRRRQPA